MTLIEENNQKKEVSNNPYDVLGISRTSSSEKARKVFLEKCKRLHPDKRTHGREEEEENNPTMAKVKETKNTTTKMIGEIKERDITIREAKATKAIGTKAKKAKAIGTKAREIN